MFAHKTVLVHVHARMYAHKHIAVHDLQDVTYCRGKPICRQAETSVVRCGVLQCVVANKGWQPIHYRPIMLQCIAVCCSVLRCVAVYCALVQCVAMSFSVLSVLQMRVRVCVCVCMHACACVKVSLEPCSADQA